MATIKLFTDLSQSKALAKVLSHESADMRWQYIEEDNGQLQWFCFPKDFSINQHNMVLAWSLAALLGVLKDYTLQKTGKGVFVIYENEKTIIGTEDYDNPVDACYNMILKLKESNLL